MFINELPLPQQVIIIVLFVLSLLFFLVFIKKEGKKIVYGLKGDNREWDAPEVIMFVGIVCFVIAFFASVFAQVKIATWIPTVIELILATGLGGRALLNFVDKNNKVYKDAKD